MFLTEKKYPMVKVLVNKIVVLGFLYFVCQRMLKSLDGCRTMFLSAVFCKTGALECNAY